MEADAIAANWQRSFGAVAPIGHLCRSALQERWLRIHSLPNGKRYASSPDEYDEILARQNAAAATVLGAGSQCVFFCCEFPGEPASQVLDLLRLPHASFVMVPELASLTDYYEAIQICAAVVSWNPGGFDAIIRACADDEVGPVLFAT